MISKKNTNRLSRSLYFLVITSSMIFSNSSCSRMGTLDKVGLISLTGGTAGTIMQYSSSAQAAAAVGGSAVGGLLPAAAALVTASVPATAEQSRRAEIVGREYVSKITPQKRAYFKEQKIKYVAVKTKKNTRSRGEPVMIYDIEKKKLASPKAFDVRIEPSVGTKIKVDTYVTEYVGEGEFVDPPSPTGGNLIPKLPKKDKTGPE